MQDTVVYHLVDGRELVYIGTTNDLSRQEQQHKDEGTPFTVMFRASEPMTESDAQNERARQMFMYLVHHGGSLPRYNRGKKSEVRPATDAKESLFGFRSKFPAVIPPSSLKGSAP